MKIRYLVVSNYTTGTAFEKKEDAIEYIERHFTKKECEKEEWDIIEQEYNEDTEDWDSVEYDSASKYCLR